MTKYIPIFIKENLRYFREEKEGYWTFISKAHPEVKELICNPTAYQVLTSCNGKNCVSDIYRILENRYPKVDKERIRMDINKTLITFSRVGIVNWNGINPFENKMEETLKNDLSGSIGYETDLPIIMEFLNSYGIPQRNYSMPKDFIFYSNPLLPSKFYYEVNVRQRIFGYIEEFFLLRQKENLIGIVTLGLNSNVNTNLPTNVGTFNLIILNEKYGIFSELLNYVLNTFPLISIKEPTKVTFLGLENHKEIRILLEKNRFTFEGALKNEIGFNKNISIFAYYYSKSFLEDIKCKLKKGISYAHEFS